MSRDSERSVEGKMFLTILCILTIVGSVMGMMRGWFYQLVAEAASSLDDEGGEQYVRGWYYVLLDLGTLFGAIAMLNRARLGLFLYTACQAVYLFMILQLAVPAGAPGLTLASPFLVPSLAMLILYWLPVNTRLLK